VVSSDKLDLSAHIDKLRGRQIGKLLKLQCVTNVVLAVMSSPRVLHLKRSHPGIMNLLPEILVEGISKPTPAKKTWDPKKPYVEKQKTIEREHLLSALS